MIVGISIVTILIDNESSAMLLYSVHELIRENMLYTREIAVRSYTRCVFHLKSTYSFCFNDVSLIQISETLKIRQSSFDTVVSFIIN